MLNIVITEIVGITLETDIIGSDLNNVLGPVESVMLCDIYHFF